ncbi:MAG: phospholipase D-like domain-containing protein [Pseudomonadota bacterium]|nr:phospholipase D-like domain-containing protein [Pseudomonadota bacterium]
MSEIILLALLGLLAALLILYFTRGTVIKRIRLIADGVETPAVDTPTFHATFTLLTQTQLYPGNTLEPLLNGDGIFPRLWEDLRAARQVIFLHVYYYRPGRVADQAREVLAERARAGVKVYVLLDAFGARLDKDYVASLKAAGVQVAVFRPLRFATLYKVQQRMHVRLVIIDGRVGYSGGFGFADCWLGDGRHPGQWRETGVRMQGPVVDQLQVAFIANWAEATGDLLLGSGIISLHDFAPHGRQEAGIMYSAPSVGSTNVERFFVLSIAAARRRLWITNAYFVPSKDFHRLLGDAARRGVDVRVLAPGASSDRPSAWYAGRTHYEDLLRAGVRIFEYQPAMIHAKTLVVDGLWATVGTFNFDNRSMKLNNEVALMVRDREFGAQLEAAFAADLDHAREITLEEVRKRGWTDRLKENASRLVAPLL